STGRVLTRTRSLSRRPQRRAKPARVGRLEMRGKENQMAIIDGMLQELEQEAQTTRRVLERVPQAHLGWKPHEKSMSLGQLALHVATVPGNVAELATKHTIPEPPSFVQAEAATTTELVPALAESVARAKRALGGFDDARMGATWRLQSGGKDIM